MGTSGGDLGQQQPWLPAPACAEAAGGHCSETEGKWRESQVQLKRGGAREGEKGKNVEKFLCRRGSFQLPLITSQHCLSSFPSSPFLLPLTLNSFHWVLKRASQLVSMLSISHLSSLPFYTVARSIFLKYESDHVILSTQKPSIVSLVYLTKSWTQYGIQGHLSSGSN